MDETEERIRLDELNRFCNWVLASKMCAESRKLIGLYVADRVKEIIKGETK